MSVRALLLALGCGLIAALTSQAEEETTESARIPRLISQLGSDKFTQRDQASKALDAIGAPALNALKESAGSSDLEVKRRSLSLIKKIEARVETERLLAPSRVRLELRDATIAEALQELARKSGHSIVLQGQPSSFAGRRVTVDTGETTFWQALDAVCRQAELCEAGMGLANNGLLVAQARAEQQMAEAIIIGQLGRAGGFVPAPVVRAPRAPQVAATRPGESQTFSPAPAKAHGIPIVLSAGTSDAATCYHGGVRVRATAHAFKSGQSNEMAVRLDVAAEPTLQTLQIRTVRVEGAEGDKGQALSQVAVDSPAMVNRNHVFKTQQGMLSARIVARDQISVQLQQPTPAATGLKEFKGTIVASVQTAPEPQITVDDVQKSAGKTIPGCTGGSIKVNEFTFNNGQVRLRIELEPPSDPEGILLAAGGNPAMAANVALLNARRALVARPGLPGGLMIAGASINDGRGEGLTLFDDKGEPFPMTRSSLQMRAVNNAMVQEFVVSFRPGKDQGSPAKLVYKSSRTSTIEFPFVFHDLKLP